MKSWHIILTFLHPLINTQFNITIKAVQLNETLIYLENSLCLQLQMLAMTHSFMFYLLILKPDTERAKFSLTVQTPIIELLLSGKE